MTVKKLTTIVMFTLIATAIAGCAMDVPTPTGVAPVSTETVSVGDREIVLQVSGPTTGPRYDRDSYDYPADRDGDCVNTRHEVLASQSTVEPDYSRDGCYGLDGGVDGPVFRRRLHEPPRPADRPPGSPVQRPPLRRGQLAR